jgi:hypothetical protein
MRAGIEEAGRLTQVIAEEQEWITEQLGLVRLILPQVVAEHDNIPSVSHRLFLSG